MASRFVSTFLWDQSGFVLSSESLLMGTSVVLGLLVGLVSIRDGLVMEFEDFSEAIGFLNQTYEYSGVVGNGGNTTQGGFFRDTFDGDDETDIFWLGDSSES